MNCSIFAQKSEPVKEKLATGEARPPRWWGFFPLGILIWHSCNTIFYENPQYLLFVCYTANLLVAIGIICRWRLIFGMGFLWTVAALPLFIYDNSYESVSSTLAAILCRCTCMLFHVSGFIVGLLVLKFYRLPKFTWLAALGLGLALQVLARSFSDESLNINAAFRVYQGWEGVFSDYTVYTITMLLSFGISFILLQWGSNRLFGRKERK